MFFPVIWSYGAGQAEAFQASAFQGFQEAAYMLVQPTQDPLRVAALTLDLGNTLTAFSRLPSPNLWAGSTGLTFGDDLYDRIHYSATSFPMGTLIGTQVRTLTVWNAYRRVRILNSLGQTGMDGITITGQPTPPLQYAPLQERAYTLTITGDGPTEIDAAIAFNFDMAETGTVTITGSRVTTWTWLPDWSAGMLERLEWRTDVIQAYRGQEQARALRINPRQTVEFTVTAEATERRLLEATLWNWGARVFAVPLWYDAIELTADLPIGSTTIPVAGTYRDFRTGSQALLMNGSTSEVVEIATSGATITLARATTKAWTGGTRLYPLRSAVIDGSASLSRFSGVASTVRLRFEMTEPAQYTANAGATTYRGYPVLTDRPDWSEEFSLSMDRKLSVLDANTGRVNIEDIAQMPMTTQLMRWTLTDRAEIHAYRQRAFALRGKQGRLWVPTWTDDLTLATATASADTNIDVTYCGYSDYLVGAINRRDIRIELQNGTAIYRRITGATRLNATTERLSLDSAIGADLNPTDIAQICYLALCRPDSDAVELAYFHGEVADTALTMRSMRHDV